MASRKTQGTSDQVEGRNPVLEALRGPREVHEIYLADAADRSDEICEIIQLAAATGVPVKDASRQRIDSMARTSAPQGVIAKVAPYRYLDLGEMLELVASTDDALLLALDGVEDPQNLGALLRVADAAGVNAVVITGRHSAGITPAVTKASAGAVEHVTVAQVSSLPAALERLKSAGLWIAGAESEGGMPYYEMDMTVPMVLVLGGEGKGLGRLTKERCDRLLSLPMSGGVSSLNVATAGAAILFEAVRQRVTRA